MKTNIEVFLELLLTIPGINKLGHLDSTKEPFISFNEHPSNNQKNFLMVFCPLEIINAGLAKRFSLTQGQITASQIGKIVAVNEYKNYREALLTVPLQYFQNTSYRKYLEQYPVKFQMTPVCFIYVAVIAGHPLYNYLDAGNSIITKFLLYNNNRVFTKLGKANVAYQYISVFDKAVNVGQYSEHYFLNSYRKKIRELSSVYADIPDVSAFTVVNYRDVNINTDETADQCLFEVDYTTEYDLANIPKLELAQLSKVKENTTFAKTLLDSLPSLENDAFIELPSKLQIKKDRVVYAGQELYSSIITPEDFIFNTKQTFPAFPVDGFTNKVVYYPVLTNRTAETLDWDTYFTEFIKYNWIKAVQYPEIKVIIGSVPITLRYNKESKLFYLNDKRVNKLEVPEILSKAVCARTAADYAEVLDIISKTSLEMHRFLSSGLTLQLNLNRLPEYLKGSKFLKDLKLTNFDISFRIIRIKNRNFIELLEKKDGSGLPELVGIKDSRAIMDLAHSPSVSWSRVEQIFGSGTKVLEKEIDLKIDASGLLEKARQRYIDAFELSKKLLESSIAEVGAKKLAWKGKNGIWVKGISGTEYFIQVSNLEDPLKGEPDCQVSHYPSDSHICIVDKHNAKGGNQMGLDKVVARMYALRNDSLVADHIHTIQGYVNKAQ